MHRSVYRYVGHPGDDRAVRQRLKEIAETRMRYAFRGQSLSLSWSDYEIQRKLVQEGHGHGVTGEKRAK